MINQAESLVGKNTLEFARYLISSYPEIEYLLVRQYRILISETSFADKEITLSRKEFLNVEVLEKLISNQKSSLLFALDSRVIMKNGAQKYFQMLDMAPRKSELILDRVINRIKEVIFPIYGSGVLIETEKSYHYFGDGLINKDEWVKFLGTSLLTSIVTYVDKETPKQHEMIVDYRYVGHSLRRGYNGLRFTTNNEKRFLPKVISVIA